MAYPLLPKLRKNSNIVIPESETGKWVTSTQNTVQNLINDLDVQTCNQNACIAAIPDMWARPLLFEMALADTRHILHKKTLGEWRGMMAVLALKEIKNIEKLNVKKIDFVQHDNQLSNLLLLRTLSKFKPKEGIQGLSWDSIHIITNANKPLGFFSPSTIVCTATECSGALQGINWTDGQCLIDPIPFLNQKECGALSAWLQQICDELLNNMNSTAAQMMVSLLRHSPSGTGDEPGFIDALAVRTDQAFSFALSSDFHKYDSDLQGPFVRALRPISAMRLSEQSGDFVSDVEIVPSNGKKPETRLLIVDDGISVQWQIEPKEVAVANHATLSSIPFSKLIERDKFGGVNLQGIAEIRTPKDFFLSQLHVVDIANAFLGTSVDLSVMIGEQPMSAILPISDELVKFFTPGDLKKIVNIQGLPGGDVVVSLSIPLSKGKIFRIERKYEKAKDEIRRLVAANSMPVLEIWPQQAMHDWKANFTYCEKTLEDEAFVAQPFPYTVENDECRRIGREGFIYKTREYPEAMICSKDEMGHSVNVGIIPLHTAEAIGRGPDTWKVGIDFGTTNTSVFKSDGDHVAPLNLKTRMRQVSVGNPTNRQNFVSGNFVSIAEELNVPFLSFFHVPIEERSTGEIINKEKKGPLLDGHISFFPSYGDFEAGKKGNHFDLKWGGVDERAHSKLFLRQLALHIAAEAVANRVGFIDWRFSFPSAFSPGETRQMENMWQDIVKEVFEITGVKSVADWPSAKSESVATAYYFAKTLNAKFSRGVICMDIGGGSTDISVWQGMEQSLRLQTSLRFAGRDVFLRLLQKCPQFLIRFGVDQLYAKRLSTYANDNKKFVAQLDALLKQKGTSLLSALNEHGKEKEVLAFLSMMALGLSGIFYYLGMLLADLCQRQRYLDKEGLPDVFVGGNGIRLFDWVAVGKYRSDASIAKLFRIMMKQGANDYFAGSGGEKLFLSDYQAVIQITPNPKAEVGFGLVTDEIELTHDKSNKLSEEARCIAGIEFESGTNAFGWKTEIDAAMLKAGIQIPNNSNQFALFVEYFNSHVKEAELLPVIVEKTEIAEVRARVNENLARTRTKATEDIATESLFITMLKVLLEVKSDAWAQKCKS